MMSGDIESWEESRPIITNHFDFWLGDVRMTGEVYGIDIRNFRAYDIEDNDVTDPAMLDRVKKAMGEGL